MEAFKLHQRLDEIAPLLSSVEWCVLRLLLSVQNKLESNKVTGSLVVPLIWDLRTSLTDVLDEDDASKVRAMLLLFLQALLKNLHSRWGDGSGIMVYEKGPRRQPQDFRLEMS